MNLTIALPAEDRRRSYLFYMEALGFQAPGDLAEDGAPEPLRIVVAEGVSLMLIPPGGFGWTIGGGAVAGASDPTECQLVITVDSRAEVHERLERARAAGAAILVEPADHGWAYTANFADPDGHRWMLLAAP